MLNCQEHAFTGVWSAKPKTKLDVSIGEPTNPRNAGGGSAFLPWLQEAIRDEEVAVIFLKEFWPRIVGDQLAKSTEPLRLRNRTLEIGVSGREWERVLQGMARPLMAKVNEFWNRSLVRRRPLHWP